MGYSLSNQSSSSATSSGFQSVGFMFAPQTGSGDISGSSSTLIIAAVVVVVALLFLKR